MFSNCFNGYIVSTDTFVAFRDQVGLVRLGKFCLKLEKNILFGIGEWGGI